MVLPSVTLPHTTFRRTVLSLCYLRTRVTSLKVYSLPVWLAVRVWARTALRIHSDWSCCFFVLTHFLDLTSLITWYSVNIDALIDGLMQLLTTDPIYLITSELDLFCTSTTFLRIVIIPFIVSCPFSSWVLANVEVGMLGATVVTSTLTVRRVILEVASIRG